MKLSVVVLLKTASRARPSFLTAQALRSCPLGQRVAAGRGGGRIMKRRVLAGLVVLVLLLGSSGVSADPTNWGHLAQIILWLRQMDETLKDINGVVEDL